MKPPIVIYLGPSMLDGSPVVVLASTGSKNVKTGSMVQTWIMRADMHPSEASAQKKDSAVCGNCPRRHSLGGDCYVQIVHAPRSVWENWDNQGRPGENWSDHSEIVRLQSDALAHGLRLGSYGDPMAVPWTVWADLISALNPAKTVGYTHQWRSLPHAADLQKPIGVTDDRAVSAQWYREHIMASCDSIQDQRDASFLGWRTFTALPQGSEVPERSIQCPATRSQNPLQCHQCGACDGAGKGAGKASVFLWEHGMRSSGKMKRSAALAVLP